MRSLIILLFALLVIAAAQKTTKQSTKSPKATSASPTTTAAASKNRGQEGKSPNKAPTTSTATTKSGKKGKEATKKNNKKKKQSQPPPTYSDFKKKYKKTYKTKAEEAAAEKAYNANREAIIAHNNKEGVSYQLKANEYSDKTPEELAKTRRGYSTDIEEGTKQKKSKGKRETGKDGNKDKNDKKEKNEKEKDDKKKNDSKKNKKPKENGPPPSEKKMQSSIPNYQANEFLPATFDLTSQMSPVKDQKLCGASWAFAVVATIEYWSNVNATNMKFSEQYFVDCQTDNEGCDGGSPRLAFLKAINEGMADEAVYPFTGIQDTCQNPALNYVLPNGGYIKGIDEETLKLIIYRYGPVVAGIQTLGVTFDFYSSGVFYHADCFTGSLDHAVVVVGWGTDATEGDYWIVKNSWGITWGMDGYGWMARNKNNHCGIASIISYPQKI